MQNHLKTLLIYLRKSAALAILFFLCDRGYLYGAEATDPRELPEVMLRSTLPTQHPLEQDIASLTDDKIMVVYFAPEGIIHTAKYDLSNETFYVTYDYRDDDYRCQQKYQRGQYIMPLREVINDEFLQEFVLKPGGQHISVGVVSHVQKDDLSMYDAREFKSSFLRTMFRGGFDVLEQSEKMEICQFGQPLHSKELKQIIPFCKARRWISMEQDEFVHAVKKSGFGKQEVFIVTPQRGVLKGRLVKSVFTNECILEKGNLYSQKMCQYKRELRQRYPYNPHDFQKTIHARVCQ